MSKRAPLPTLFLSHGSPMHALDAGAAGKAWAKLGRTLPRPRALLIASAHWETNLPMLTGNPKPETIHDFFGFPEPLYRIRYAAPGEPEIAARALAALKDAGFTAALDGCRGLDHGAWSPLLHMYPEADVPVVQVSLQTALGPRHHLALGRALAPLAAEGVLVIGSGHMTHNLRDRRADGAPPLAYAREFQTWTDAQIRVPDLDALADYRSRGPHGARAHPTEEHFMPLFFALGAAAPVFHAERIHDGIESGALAMDAYRFDPVRSS
ncbi:MAG: dioxygenase [Betaproteobacteria bacterium]|nr:MAG: dioxygenase [Betaproteobacteria bacterium]